MYSLVLKDLILQRKILLILALASIVVVPFVDLVQPSQLIPVNIGAVAIFMVFYIYGMYTFNFDEKDHGETIVNSLPVTRKTIVIARYLVILIVIAAFGALVLAIEAISQSLGLIKPRDGGD
jgi:ABC-2 type transport system permease protein